MTTVRKTQLITLGTLCFALFMVMLDSTVVNLALHTIQLKLHADYTELQWIVDAYILLLASLLLTGGTLGDMLGRRRVFAFGVALFTLGSLACALAPSISYLIAFRALQGVGAAALMPSTLSILTKTFPDPAERAKAIGTWAGVSGLALAIGPLVGGTMVDNWGWQSIFQINVPIGIIALFFALRFIPESSDRDGRGLDLFGQAFAIVGLAALTYAFIEANTYGWTSTRILSCFIASAIALSLFIVIELRGRSPMLQLGFFRNATFAGANAVGVIISFAFFGAMFFLSLFMQQVQGYSATRAGVLQLPATLGVMTAAILSGRIVARSGSRLPITIGLTAIGVAMLLLTGVQPTTAYASYWPWLLVMGVGMGLVMAPMTAAIMSTVPAARAGMASATSNTMRQVGSVFGIAVLGNLVTRRSTHDFRAALHVMRLPAQLVERILAGFSQGGQAPAGAAPRGVDMAAVHVAGNAAFTSGMHVALWVSGVLLLLGAPIALVTIRNTAPGSSRSRAVADAEAKGTLLVEPSTAD
jgi:EmrB/QacA subfamily drug resistance transporter